MDLSKVTVLIVGHGSRDAASNAEFEQLVALYAEKHPEVHVAFGYIELAVPALQQALAELAPIFRQIVVVPLMLFAAGHVKNDIPLALAQVRQQFPQTLFLAAPALGVHPSMAALAFARLEEAVALSAEEAKQTAVIVVGRGSSDPDANGDFCKLTRLFSEGRGFALTLPAFIGITGPAFLEAAELAARTRPKRIVIVPYMLFSGRLISKLAEQAAAFKEQYPWIVTVVASYLGAHKLLLNLIEERITQTLQGSAPLPCDSCQYRVPLPGLTQNVGGLKALLWSIRHTFTHNQAAPHIHSHKPIRKHVLVCGNVDCVDRGSLPLLDSLRRLIKEKGKEKEIQVTRTSCMGRCGEGPTVAVYPDGIWYRGVTEKDAETLTNDHLLSDKLVTHLVDNIMS